MSSDGASGRRLPVTSEDFRRACGRFATGVTIASVLDAGGAPHGLTVNSFSAVSLDPPLVLICLGHAVSVIAHFRAARHFGINILAEDQRDLSDRFARKGQDRFDGLDWHAGETGVPILPGVVAAVECAVHERFTSGDHDIFVGEMVAAHLAEGMAEGMAEREPLIYFASRYRGLK